MDKQTLAEKLVASGRVEFEIFCHEEHTPVRGNVTCIDPKTDRENEKMIIAS